MILTCLYESQLYCGKWRSNGRFLFVETGLQVAVTAHRGVMWMIWIVGLLCVVNI